ALGLSACQVPTSAASAVSQAHTAVSQAHTAVSTANSVASRAASTASSIAHQAVASSVAPTTTAKPATTTKAGSSSALAVGRSGPGTYPAGPCHYRGGETTGPFTSQALPDPACTPGAVDPAVTQADLDRTVCREGWTDTVRPPESYTEPLKFAALAAYGQPGVAHLYELDHLVPLELGGAPSDPRNLWPEPDDHPEGPSGYYANSKDWVEHELNRAVCDRRVPLAAAQEAVAGDWETALGRLGLPSVPPWER
ncbi:MAG: hypothetical protein ACRDZQ_06540, partial [Acidimicrobiales bacterium]